MHRLRERIYPGKAMGPVLHPLRFRRPAAGVAEGTGGRETAKEARPPAGKREKQKIKGGLINGRLG
ncbi:hypothetical protein A6M21_08695 [Desulfotomaculum copahuensis]|uniref:Uncharacterized protein n=1 Tax=Desulfotomaculum copahuensis TaxID=1838280 RepID=A0A1B7LF24_9FIRM|nr:hypothetical protein A6M21_08695 [Desulfotomaculum copahuensis]